MKRCVIGLVCKAARSIFSTQNTQQLTHPHTMIFVSPHNKPTNIFIIVVGFVVCPCTHSCMCFNLFNSMFLSLNGFKTFKKEHCELSCQDPLPQIYSLNCLCFVCYSEGDNMLPVLSPEDGCPPLQHLNPHTRYSHVFLLPTCADSRTDVPPSSSSHLSAKSTYCKLYMSNNSPVTLRSGDRAR